MASSVHSVALNLFYWAKDDPSRIAQIRTAFDAAMTAGALTKGGLDAVIQATKNSVTMQKTVGMSENDRQTALRWALKWLEVGYVTSGSRSLGRF